MNWTKTNDFYNREVVTSDVYSRPILRGTVYVMDQNNFKYTFSCGANSDRSYTGSFYQCTKIKTVQDAMEALNTIIALGSKDKEIRTFIDSLK